MPKDIIPKPEKTAEVINENLLKYTFLCKRLAKRKNVVPRKFVNRHKYKYCRSSNIVHFDEQFFVIQKT